MVGVLFVGICVRPGMSDFFGLFGGDREPPAQINDAKVRIETFQSAGYRLFDRKPDTKEYAASGDFSHLRGGRHKCFRLFAGGDQNGDAARLAGNRMNKTRQRGDGNQNLGPAGIRRRLGPASAERNEHKKRRQKGEERPMPPSPFFRAGTGH